MTGVKRVYERMSPGNEEMGTFGHCAKLRS